MSSVQLPRHAIGTETARSLLDALQHGVPAVPAKLAWALVVRGSTAGG
jgi:DNA-binding LacI/PurR family transcriptional regulator